MSAAARLEKFWYSTSVFKWLLFPLSFFVRLIAVLKRYLYQKEIIKPYQAPVPVLVVGNISVGGTGKTPIIASMVKELSKQGVRIGLVSRGYKSSIKSGAHLVQDSDDASLIGDEVLLLRNKLQVPFAIGPDRCDAVKLLLKHYNLDLIISDDGLQHYQLKRDYEIVMIDGTRGMGNGLMIPFGPLREPVSRLKSVDAVVVNSGKLETHYSLAANKMFNCEVKVEGLYHLKTNNKVALTNLKENSVTAVSGIGNPFRFHKTLKEIKSEFKAKNFNDHHYFCESDFDDIDSKLVVMTEKDAVKCKDFAADNWYYLKIYVSVGNELIQSIVEKLKLIKES